MFDLCPFMICICGCQGYTRRVKNPSPELVRVLQVTQMFNCVNCRQLREPVVYQHVNWFTFFCLPVFPYSRGNPYIGCPVCFMAMQPGSEANRCRACSHWVEDWQRFCPNCGDSHV